MKQVYLDAVLSIHDVIELDTNKHTIFLMYFVQHQKKRFVSSQKIRVFS